MNCGDLTFLKNEYELQPTIFLNNLSTFVLVMDLPNWGGGAVFFLSAIVTHYKNHGQNFVILRSIHNKLAVFVNNHVMLDTLELEENGIVQLLNDHKMKICKIFVNHTIGHTSSLIEYIFTLNKEITYITHDYHEIFTHYHLMNPTNKTPKIPSIIQKFDHVIMQHAKNAEIFKEYLDPKQHVIVTELPDFKQSLDKHTTNNDVIVVGLIGIMYDIKGRDFVIALHNYIVEHQLNMKIIVFGAIDADIPSYYYNTINEFNDLLIAHKPNLWLETTITPETYSYSLTLCMLTQLPILSLQKGFELVIFERLKVYSQHQNNVFFFQDMPNCIELISKAKQDYFYTIEAKIYFNDFWDNYFLPQTL